MLTLDDIFQAANEGDSFARRHLDFVVQQFSVLIYNMQLTYDPDEIIIQGIYNKAEGYFQDTLRSTIRQLSLHSIQNNMKLTFSPNYISANGLPMTMIGAALFCFDQYFDQLEFFV